MPGWLVASPVITTQPLRAWFSDTHKTHCAQMKFPDIIRFLLLPVMLLTGVQILAQEESPEDARAILVSAITSKERKVQIANIESLSTSGDEIVPQVLNGWKRGEVFMHESEDGTKVPFMLEILEPGEADDKPRKAIAIIDGSPITVDGKELILSPEQAGKSVRTNSKIRKAMSRTLDYIALSSNDPKKRARSQHCNLA